MFKDLSTQTRYGLALLVGFAALLMTLMAAVQ
ncbi:MAG: hypothetical protein RLZZ385_2465 [Pseudomonadota bacterium]|jgi:hypothetical protein